MQKAAWILVTIVGIALIGAGVFVLLEASRAVSAGESLWGMGWAFLDISPREVNAYRAGAAAGMIFGVIMVVLGLVKTLRD